MNTEVIEQECYGSCCFMNLCGDIQIVWDEHNKEQILEMVRKKMKEGYVFFTTKKIAFNRLKRKVKITEKNIDQTEEIIVTDKQFEKMISDMDDRDIASLVKNDQATLVKRKGRSEIATIKKANKAEDVIDKNSVAIRPVVGG